LGPPPDVEIISPTEGAVITDVTDVIGTVSSQALDYWTLEYRLMDPSVPAWTEFARGTTTVSNALLDELDPTMLLNGIYEIRLTAVDISGRFAAPMTAATKDHMTSASAGRSTSRRCACKRMEFWGIIGKAP
jgi:hypothetical protein